MSIATTLGPTDVVDPDATNVVVPFEPDISQQPRGQDTITLSGDGLDGQDGVDGKDGQIQPGSRDGGDGEDATEPEVGHDGQDMVVKLSTLDGDHECHFKATAKDELLLDERFPLDAVPTLRWSSRGGCGGNGAHGGRGCSGLPGLNGKDATKEQPGTNGTAGGGGGAGGRGTSGADGGSGGRVKVVVEERDSYLLMVVDPCQFTKSLLIGGKHGKEGSHGSGGKGGIGGDGGRAFIYEEDDDQGAISPPVSRKKKKQPAVQVKIKIPGGSDGHDGSDGETPQDELDEGIPGETGDFCIEVVGHEGDSYEGRYNLEYVDCEVQGESPMAGGECEFGDVLSVHSIVVRNTGLMPTPSNQMIRLAVKEEHNPSVNPLESTACIPAGTHLLADETTVSEGELSFFAGYPADVKNPEDFEPLNLTTYFHLQAFQMGPKGTKISDSLFSREYRNFHRGKGIPITFRYPVENTMGLVGLSSLHPGEQSFVSLQLENVGLESIGGREEQQRRLAVRFFVNTENARYNVEPNQLKFSTAVTAIMEGGEDLHEEVDLSGPGQLLDVPTLHPGTTYSFRAMLSFREKVPYYSRTALQVDILVETLPLPEGVEIVQDEDEGSSRFPKMSVIQRRKLELVCEPKYEPLRGARVVLVTSAATTREQYESWALSVLTHSYGVEYETYSVSRYGTLDPYVVLDDDTTTLREAFNNKLVILLTEPFFPDPPDEECVVKEVHPHHLLLSGCMAASSGFDPSTRWLVVGGNAELQRDLLDAHLSIDEPDEGEEFTDVNTFHKHVQNRVQEQSTMGRGADELPLREDIVHVDLPSGGEAHKLKRMAESLGDWLRQNDPLCQYTIEYKEDDFEQSKKGRLRKRSLGTLTVRRGYCRSENTAVVVSGDNTMNPECIKGSGILLSLAEALSRDVRVSLFCEAIRKDLPTTTLTAIKFASVSELVREQVVFLDCSMKMNEDLELSFPTIGSFLDNVEVLSLIRDAKSSRDLKHKACEQFSDLLARFEMVANSKDLRPRFSMVGRSKKKTTHEAMLGIVDRLRVQWKPVLDNSLVDQHKKAIKEEIRSFLQEDTGKKKLNVRADQRWIQGLNHVHSVGNENSFGLANPSKRLIELDVEEADKHKIPPPSVRVYSSTAMSQLLQERTAHSERATTVARGIQTKRNSTVHDPSFDFPDLL